MQKSNLQYHFSILLEFFKDVDVEAIEKQLGIKAHKLTLFKDAKPSRKTAKIWFKSKDCENIMINEVFEQFIESLKDNFSQLADILKQNNGICNFELVFTKLSERPSIALSTGVIQLLNNWNASFSIDFLN